VNEVQRNIPVNNVVFPDGRQTTLVETLPGTSASELITKLDLATADTVTPKAVILIAGGTNIPDANSQARLHQLFSRGLTRAVAENSALIIDGSTAGEVMTALSKALLDRNVKAPLLGIANDSQITWPGRDGVDGADGHKMLESNYTHFVVVKSLDSDGVIDKMYEIAEILSQDIPVLTILVNDSPVAKDEVVRSVRQGWPILVIAGSGGFADQIQQAWQDKQDYIQKLSVWKPGDPNKPKPVPSFIDDPVLAEVIAEGDLHFFPITEAPEKLEMCIDLRLKANDILSQAYGQSRVYSADAMRQQHTFHRQQLWILLLGVFITALAAFQAFYKQMQWNVPLLSIGSFKLGLGDVLYYVLISVPVLLALLIAGANRFDPGNRWVTMRTATEAFKREMFRYRTRTGIYSDIQVVQNKTTREARLAKMLESINSQWVEGNLDFAIFPALTRLKSNKQSQTRSTAKEPGPGKPKVKASVYLPPNRYIEERMVDQLNWYKGKSQELGRKLIRFQWIILGLGGLATLLAAIHFELVITVTTAVATAMVAYLEYNQVANTLKQYNHAILTLTNIQNWWIALGDAQADQANIDKLVDDVETTLQSEQAGWVQQMQTALTELRAQQAKQGEASSTTESVNKGLEDHLNINKSQNGQQSLANLDNPPSTGSTPVNGPGTVDGSDSLPTDDRGPGPTNGSGSAPTG